MIGFTFHDDFNTDTFQIIKAGLFLNDKGDDVLSFISRALFTYNE